VVVHQRTRKTTVMRVSGAGVLNVNCSSTMMVQRTTGSGRSKMNRFRTSVYWGTELGDGHGNEKAAGCLASGMGKRNW